MYIPIAVALCFAAVSVTSIRHDIHKRMTPKELQYVFQATHENVPEYKVVDLEVTERVKRYASQETQVNLVGFDKRVSLLLKPASDYLVDEGTRVTLATGSHGRVTYRDDKSIMPRVGKLLRDEATKSSVILSQNNQRAYSLEGYIGNEDLVLKPLPLRFAETLSRKVRSANGTVSSSNSVPHVLYRPIESVSIANKQEFARINRSMSEILESRDKRSSDELKLYLELLLVVDYTTYRLHDSDAVRVARYVANLWNIIDMLYRDLKNLRINIARIVIGTNTQATPYINDHTSGDRTRVSDAINAIGIYFFQQQDEFPTHTYDAIMTMTANKLINKIGKEIAGLAYMATVCRKGYNSVPAVGIFQSPGNYIEMTPTHELGHVLGLDHDGEKPCTDADNLYLMTAIGITNENNWYWSRCSSRLLAHELQKRECLYNEPKRNGRPLRPILPGQILSRDEQCQKQYGPKSSAFDNNNCVGLKCHDPVVPRRYWTIEGPAEGTPCAEDAGFCFMGKCIEYPKDRAAYGLAY